LLRVIRFFAVECERTFSVICEKVDSLGYILLAESMGLTSTTVTYNWSKKLPNSGAIQGHSRSPISVK